MTDDNRLPSSLLQTVPEAREMARAIIECETRLRGVAAQMSDARGRGALQLARAFVVLHRLRDKLDGLSKQFSELFEDYKVRQLPEALEAEGVTSVPLAEGFRVGVTNNFRASIRKDMRDAAFDWLRENGLGDLITDTVNASTLSAAARHEMEENGREFPESIFNVAIVPTTSVTKTK